jgi:hypothetical protein
VSELAIVSIVLGVLVLAGRGPLLVSPGATIEIYRKIIATEIRIRVAAICGALLGLWVVLSVSGSLGFGAWIYWVWGWLAVGVASLAMVFPSAYRAFAESVADWFDSSGFARPMGAITVALGALLLYLGFFVF